MTSVLRATWLSLLIVLLFLVLLSGIAFVLIDWFSVIRFVPSLNWQDKTSFIVGPITLVPAAALCWPQIVPGYIEYIEKKVARLFGRKISAAPLKQPNEYSFWFIFYVFVSPMLVWYAIVVFVLVWIPMVSAALISQNVHHEFVVAHLDERSGSIPARIVLQSRSYFKSAIPAPPREVWKAAQPGDVLKLYGKGNDHGIFYTEMTILNRH